MLELANMSNVSHSFICRLESEQRNSLSFAKLCRVSFALGVNVATFDSEEYVPRYQRYDILELFENNELWHLGKPISKQKAYQILEIALIIVGD